jgi:hypothetical protein
MKNNATLDETRKCVQFVSKLGKTFDHEDELIAHDLSCPEVELQDAAFARLHSKYYEIVCDYLQFRYSNISASGRDVIADMAFDRIRECGSAKPLHTKDGSLSSYVILICEWAAWEISRLERRRRFLLTRRFQELWCVQRETDEQFKSNKITEQDIDELLSVMRRTLDPKNYPKTALVLEAMAAVFIQTGGLQIEGQPRNPSLTAIKNHLENKGFPMTEEEIKQLRNVLRAVAKKVLTENGWEIECPVTKYV